MFFNLPGAWKALACRYTRTTPFSQIELPSALKGAVDKRRADFLAGRACVLELYKTQNVTLPLPVYIERSGPLWPEGWVGSISHTWLGDEGIAAAVLAPQEKAFALGHDLEGLISEETLARIRKSILFSGEEWCQSPLDMTLAFSLKESIYKALNPLLNRFIGFDEVAILQRESGVLEFEPRGALRADFPKGAMQKGYGFVLDGSLIYTYYAPFERSERHDVQRVGDSLK